MESRKIGREIGDFRIVAVTYEGNKKKLVGVCNHCGTEELIPYDYRTKTCKCQKEIGKYIGQIVNGFEILDGYCRVSKSGGSRSIVYKVKCTNCGVESEKYRNCLFKDAQCRCECTRAIRPQDKRLYAIWQGMKQRCDNDEHPRYGGRGITVCSEWQEFIPFREWAWANGYSDDLSIDRVDNDGNYEPGNCRWATRIEQANNTSSNHLLTLGNKTMTIAQWSRETGIPERTIWARLSLYHWTVKDVLTAPIGKGPITRGKKPKKIQCLREGKVYKQFDSVATAAKYFDCNISAIRGALQGRWQTSCGMTWEYVEEVI